MASPTIPAKKKYTHVGRPNVVPTPPLVFIITDVVIASPTTDNRVVTQ